jgi:hypothetical protein
MSGKMEQFYTQALARYKDYQYADFSQLHRQEDGKLVQDHFPIPIHRE